MGGEDSLIEIACPSVNSLCSLLWHVPIVIRSDLKQLMHFVLTLLVGNTAGFPSLSLCCYSHSASRMGHVWQFFVLSLTGGNALPCHVCPFGTSQSALGSSQELEGWGAGFECCFVVQEKLLAVPCVLELSLHPCHSNGAKIGIKPCC